jgi:8-oxo-dGTP pyrophosphatase MutT (NUDIX family)
MALKKLGAAAFIQNAQGHVLLVKHSYGRLNWELPGGQAEADESIVETALREVREETGLVVQPVRIAGIYYDAEIDMHHFVVLCQLPDTSPAPQPDRDEITACAFWPPTALPRPISDFTIRRIEDALAGWDPPLPFVIGPRRWLE